SKFAPIAQHLREIRGNALAGGKTRAPHTFQILAQVAGVVGLVKGDREIVEHRVVIGLVARLQRIDKDEHTARLEHAPDLGHDGTPYAGREFVKQVYAGARVELAVGEGKPHRPAKDKLQ